MTKREVSVHESRLRQRAKEERRLLQREERAAARERAARRRLRAAEERLGRARRRVDRRQGELAEAVAKLRRRQAARAVEPGGVAGDSPQPATAEPVAAGPSVGSDPPEPVVASVLPSETDGHRQSGSVPAAEPTIPIAPASPERPRRLRAET